MNIEFCCWDGDMMLRGELVRGRGEDWMVGMVLVIGFFELRIEWVINNMFEENCGILNFKWVMKLFLIFKLWSYE